MTQQAINSLNLYRHGNPSTIDQLLNVQADSVVEELMQHFNCSREDLPVRLSIGG